MADVAAFPVHRRAKASCPNNNPQICPYRGNNSKGFRSLSKKFAHRDSKFYTNMHSMGKHGQRVTMQNLNKYQYRRSHSRKVGIPTVRTAQEK
ncbi:MAG: hypothetical protein LBQ23_01930 [Puniceicoccales bacterium]|nr:hypothetical protein [Puniceicoccales bacterium]